MIDFSNITLPDPNDYYKMTDGSYKLKSEVDNDPNTIHVDPNAGYFSSEGSQLLHDLKASAYGLGGVITGNQDLINRARQEQTVSNLYTKPYDSVKGVSGIADVAKLAGHYIIQGLPQIGLAVATGGIGSVGAQIANKAAGAIVTDALASKIGSYAGQFAVNSAISGGQAAANEYTNGNPNDAVKNALISSVIGGIAGTFADQQMLGKIAQRQGILPNALLGAGFNAGLGVAQTGITNALEGKETTKSELLDSALSGGLLGGAFGAFNGINSNKNKEKTDNNITPEIKTENITDNNSKPNETLENVFDNTIKNEDQNQVLPENNTIKNEDKSQSLSENNTIKNEDKSQSLTENNTIKNEDKSQSLTENNTIKNEDKSQELSENNIIKNEDKNQELSENNIIKNEDKSQYLSEIKSPDVTKEDLNRIIYKGKDFLDALNKDEMVKSYFLDSSLETRKSIAKDFIEIKKKGLTEQDFINEIYRKYNPEEKYTLNIDENTNNKKSKEYLIEDEDYEIPFDQNKQKESIYKKEDLPNNNDYDKLTREEKIAYNKENIKLNEKEINELNNVKKEIEPLVNKRLNVDIEVLHEKHSPFKYDIIKKNGWYDPVKNKIYLVAGENFQKDKVKLLKHELMHNGLYKMLKGNDFDKYKQEMNRLYQNKEVAVLADKLSEEFGYTKEQAVEEALARFAENRTLQNLPMFKRIVEFFKKILNSLLGNKEFVSSKDVQNFLAKVDEYNYLNEPIKKAYHFTNNREQSQKDGISFDEMKPEEIDKDLKGKEKGIKNANDILSGKKLAVETMNKNISNRSYEKNSKNFDNLLNNLKAKQEDLKNPKNYKDLKDNFIKTFSSMRELSETFSSTKDLRRIQDQKESVRSSILSNFESAFNRLKIQSKGLSPTDIKIINEVMGYFAHHFEYIDKNGNKKIGNYRPSQDEVRKALIQKGIKNVEKSLQRYNNLRDIFDKNIGLAMFKNLQYPFNALENILQKSNLVKDTLLPDFKLLQSEIYTGNIDNARQKLTDFFISNKSEFEKILKSEKGHEFKELYNEIKEIIKQGEESYNNGYIPKLHEGKHALHYNIKYIDNNGEEKTYTAGVFASNDKKEVNAIYDRILNDLRGKLERGEITEDALKNIELKFEERLTNVSDLSPEKILTGLERKGIILDQNLKDQLYSLSKESNNSLKRTFEGGAGANHDMEQVAAKFSNRTANEIASNYLHNEEVSLANSIKSNIEKNLFNELQRNFNGEFLPKEKGALSKLKTLTSMFQLSFSIPAFLGQVVQFLQAAPIHFAQYTGTTGIAETTRGMALAVKFIKEGTTGNAKYDEAIKNFKHPLLDASQTKMLFDISNTSSYDKGFYSKVVHYAFKPMEMAELINRYSTFINAYDIYESAINGNLNGRRASEVLDTTKYSDRNDFILKQLARINGDYSSTNMPKIMQSEIGQFFGMYQMWKIVMAEQFKHLDNRGRVAFLGTILLTAGVKGIPFEQDLEEIIDTFAQITGHKPIMKDMLNSFARDFGKMIGSEEAETYFKNGIFPSIGQRVGVGDVIPGLKGISEIITGQNTNKGLQDFLGPGATIFVGGLEGVNALGRGDVATALRHFAPSTIKNIIKAGQEFNDGYSISDDGTKRIAKTDTIDALFRLSGLMSPSQIHQIEKSQMIQELKDNANHIQNYFKTEWMQAKMKGDNEKAMEIVKNIQIFNKAERASKSGYAFNLDLNSWNKDFILAKTSAVQRGNINSNKYQQIANKEKLGVDLSRKEI
jgi:hypothetical protein